jgi:hypothetical protein
VAALCAINAPALTGNEQPGIASGPDMFQLHPGLWLLSHCALLLLLLLVIAAHECHPELP